MREATATATIDARTFNRLETIEWGMLHFGSLATNRQFPRRTMLRLVERGLVRSIGYVEMCDDDGWLIEPSREGEGFALTDAGRAALVDWRATHCGLCGKPFDALDEDRHCGPCAERWGPRNPLALARPTATPEAEG